MNVYVLDTSALLAYIESEDGAEEVERLFLNALENGDLILISMVSCIEVYYISIQEQGQAVADDRLELIHNLPIILEPLDSQLIKEVGQIKASKAMSFADACIAGLAKSREGVLVHKDPEFEQIEDQVKQLKLKYKGK